jgi:hypothetical protein
MKGPTFIVPTFPRRIVKKFPKNTEYGIIRSFLGILNQIGEFSVVIGQLDAAKS